MERGGCGGHVMDREGWTEVAAASILMSNWMWEEEGKEEGKMKEEGEKKG